MKNTNLNRPTHMSMNRKSDLGRRSLKNKGQYKWAVCHVWPLYNEVNIKDIIGEEEKQMSRLMMRKPYVSPVKGSLGFLKNERDME